MSDRLLMLTTASLLRRGRQIEFLSDGTTLIAVGLGLANLISGWICASLVLLGLLQKYWALRVALDRDLFNGLAASDAPETLDTALRQLGLKKTADTRAWPARCQGALRLLRHQALAFTAQVLLALLWLLFHG